MAIINGTSVGGMTLQADYSYTQNTSANTSTVTVTLKLVNHYALYASALSGSYLSVGGNRSDYSKSISYGGSSTTTTTLYGPKTVTVQHNSDGTGSCVISGTFVMNGTYRGSYVGTMSVSSTITLPKIARASGLTVPSSVNTGSAFSGTIAPSSTAFNHKVQLKIGSTVKDTVTLAAGTNTFSYTIPHSWLPSSTSGTITAVLETYNGNTFVASTSKNITANVPTSVVPSISAFTAAVAANGLSGLYVQGKTTAKLAATASAGSGSSISKYVYTGPDLSVSTTSNNTTTSAIKSSGTLTYYVQVTDGRGRTASKSVQIYVYPYSVPAIGSVSVQRCDVNGNLTENGTYAKYTVNSTFANVGGKNTRTITAAYSSDNGSTYSSVTTIQATTDTASSKTGTYGGGAFSISSNYIIKFIITDSYGATSFVTKPLISAQRPLNISANGKGVAIGKMSTVSASGSAGKFECGWDASFDKAVNTTGNLTVGGTANVSGAASVGSLSVNGKTLLNLIYPIGSLYMSVNNVSPQSFIGGTWERIQDRFLLAAGSTYSAGSTGGSATHTLTANEMPKHEGHMYDNFNDTGWVDRGGDANSYYLNSTGAAGYGKYENRPYKVVSGNEMVMQGYTRGGGAAHNNMPPYLTVYVWKRTA